MSARICLLVLVAVSAICFAAARKEPVGIEVTGRALKQYWWQQPSQPTTQTPQTEGTPTEPAVTQPSYSQFNPYSYQQPSYYPTYPHYGGHQPYPTRNPYNSYCQKGEIPATDDIYHRRACVPEYLFSGEPAPAPAD